MSLVEDLGEGRWLIKPTGEIRECSRSTAYRIAKKADSEIENSPAVFESALESAVDEKAATIHITESEGESENVDSFLGDSDDGLVEISDDQPSFETFQLPTLDSIGGDKSSEGDSFQGDHQSEDRDFFQQFKKAKVVEDDEGNKVLSLGELWSGSTPIISGILRSCDNALYTWSKDTHQIELWNPVVRDQQREMLVSIVGLLAPKTDITLDPKAVLLLLVGYLYGVPMFKIARHTRRRKLARADSSTHRVEVDIHE